MAKTQAFADLFDVAERKTHTTRAGQRAALDGGTPTIAQGVHVSHTGQVDGIVHLTFCDAMEELGIRIATCDQQAAGLLQKRKGRFRRTWFARHMGVEVQQRVPK